LQVYTPISLIIKIIVIHLHIRIFSVMRNAIPYLVCLLIITTAFYSSTISCAAENKHTFTSATEDTINYYLEVNGSVRHRLLKNAMANSGDNPWLDSAVVTVYMNNAVYTTNLTTKRGKCTFRLPLDRQYLVEISKPGFITKRFEINTKVPGDKKDAFDFDFDMDIFEKVEGLDVSVLDKPIAKVMFDPPNNQFMYDAAYTHRINSDIQLLYRNYYILSKKQKGKGGTSMNK
jgi:hypothetical protein